jgi:predicted AlkP superfamily pyrophosphatase or phosphodiesterase
MFQFRWYCQIMAVLLVLSTALAHAEEGPPPTPADAPYVVLIIIDGARSDLVHDLAAAGHLPNIQKLFIDGGLDVQKGVTTFPTTSTNAYQSFMTGLLPGHAGIPYLARYSRSADESIEYLSLKGIKIMNADLLNWYQLNDQRVPFSTTQGSLFNHLQDLGTASVYATFYRDAAIQIPSVPMGAAWDTFILGNHEQLDIRAYRQLRALYERPIQDVPHMTLVALLAIDVLAHQDGAHADRLKAHYETIDRMLGDFQQLLEQRGLADKTYVIVVGDHGNHDISERSYLRERLIKQGVAIRSRHMRPPYELAINARGVSAAIIAVAGKDGWKSHPSMDDLRHVPTRKGKEINLIDYLRHQPETDLLLVRNGLHQVRVMNTDSESEVTRFWSGDRYWYSYRILHGKDPLRLMGDPALSPAIATATPFTHHEWLPMTADKDYGDAIVQISQIFTDGRVGDMMIVPQHQWVFRHEKANTHGGLSQEDIHIPILIHGPGIAPQKIPYARSVDVMPTVLSWFGKHSPHRDGQDLQHPDPTPLPKERQLAGLEGKLLTGQSVTRTQAAAIQGYIRVEEARRRARIDKLSDLSATCRLKRRVEDRLTRPDRPKKMRVSTCEVVDLALKTAYEDLQRLEQLTAR